MSKYFVLSLAVLLFAVGADAAIRVTHCFGPTNLTEPTCSGNCSSFVVNEGQCFSQGSLFDSVRCLPTRARCIDVEVWYPSTTCSSGAGRRRSQNPCGLCQDYSYLKCTDTGMTYMNCSDSQCRNCQPLFNGTIGQCVPLPNVFNRNNESFKIHSINSCKLYNVTGFYGLPCTPANEAYSDVDVSGSCSMLDGKPDYTVSTRFTCVTGRLTNGQSNVNLAAHSAFVKQHGLEDAVMKTHSSSKKSIFKH